MPLCNFRSRHAGIRGIGEHQEQIRVKRTIDALPHILDVKQQMLQVNVDIER